MTATITAVSNYPCYDTHEITLHTDALMSKTT